jgi:hypothetical protein
MALTLSKRMDIVEQKLAGLENLPERMTALESQFLQLRTEMRTEFSAIRTEIQTSDDRVIRMLHEDVSALGTHMRVLHEDLVEKISRIQEGRPPGGPRPRR